MALTDEIRAAAARVAAEARFVSIDAEAIEDYARGLPEQSPPAPDLPTRDDETRAAFSLQLNAINFGSGWFPTLRKPPGLSGFRTVEAGLRRRRPYTAIELTTIKPHDIAQTLAQDPDHPLMATSPVISTNSAGGWRMSTTARSSPSPKPA